MTQVKTHVLNLEVGDRFTFAPDGPIYRRVSGPDDRVWITDDAGKLPIHKVDAGGCFVHAIDPFVRDKHEFSRIEE